MSTAGTLYGNRSEVSEPLRICVGQASPFSRKGIVCSLWGCGSAAPCRLGDLRFVALAALSLGIILFPRHVVCVATAQETNQQLKADYPDWKYHFIEVPSDLRERNTEGNLRILVQLIFRNDPRADKSLDANRVEFERYFRDIVFRRWTHPDHLTKLSEDRAYLLRLLQGSKNPQASEVLKTIIFTLMPKLAAGNFHTAVRYNAMLLLGQLNSTEAVLFGDRRPAQPRIDVWPVLLDHATKPNQIDAVRVAALIGIQRHVEAVLPNSARSEITQRLLPVLSSAPPSGRSAEAHAWIQRKVIHILAACGDVALDRDVSVEMQKILVDANKPLSLRCAAAVALGSLRHEGSLPFDPKQLAAEVGALGVEACRVEFTWLKDRLEKRLAQLEKSAAEKRRHDLDGGLLGVGDEEKSIDGSDPILAHYALTSRRRLLFRLNAVRAALGGSGGEPPGILALNRSAAAKAEVTRLAAVLDETIQVLENTEVAPEHLIIAIRDEGTKLEAQVKKISIAKARATP